MNRVDVPRDQSPKSRFRAGFHVIGEQLLAVIHLHLLLKGRPTLIPNKFLISLWARNYKSLYQWVQAIHEVWGLNHFSEGCWAALGESALTTRSVRYVSLSPGFSASMPMMPPQVSNGGRGLVTTKVTVSASWSFSRSSMGKS